MSDLLALETDAVQADALRTTVAERLSTPLRIVADPEAAIAEINRLAPAMLLVGRSVPRGRRDAVVTHAKKAAGTALIVLEIPSFRTEDAPERRFLKFGFKKPVPASGDGLDPVAFAEQLSVALAKRTDSRKRSRAPEPHAASSRGTGPAHAPADAERKVSEKVPPETPEVRRAPTQEPAAVSAADIEMVRREADVRLMAEVERVRAEATEQYQREIAALEREQAVLREAAVAQAVGDAEADAQALLRAEIERARAEADEAVEAEVARVRAEAEGRIEESTAQALQDEVARLTLEHARVLEETVSLAREDERQRHASALSSLRAEADARVASVALDAQKAAAARADQALDEIAALARQEALAHAEGDLIAAREEAAELRRQCDDALRSAAGVREEALALEAQLARAHADAAANADSLSSLRAESDARLAVEQEHAGQALAELHRALEAAQSDVLSMRTETHDLAGELARAREDAAVHTAEAERRGLDLETRLTRERQEAADELTAVRQSLAAAQAELSARQEDAARLADAMTDAQADAQRTVAEHVAAAVAQAQHDATVRLDAEVARVRAEERAAAEASLARSGRDAHDTLNESVALARDDERQRAAAAIAAAQQEACALIDAELHRVRAEAAERAEAVLAEQARESTRRVDAEVARVRTEESARADATLAEARREAEVRLEHARREARLEAEAALARLTGDTDRIQHDLAARLQAETDRSATEVKALRAESEVLRAEVSRARQQINELRMAVPERQDPVAREAFDDAVRAQVAHVREELEAGLVADLEQARAALTQTEERHQQAQLAAELTMAAERARLEADAEARVSTELARSHQEATELRAALQAMERERSAAQRAAEQALDDQRASLRAESDAASAAELTTARRQVEQAHQALQQAEQRARQADQQAREDIERLRGQVARDARMAAENAAAVALKAEVTRVKAETESRLGELINRLRADGDRVRHELDDVRVDLERARHQHSASAAADRGRPTHGGPESFGSPRHGRGGLLHDHRRLVLAGAAAAVLVGIVALDLHRVVFRRVASLSRRADPSAAAAVSHVTPTPAIEKPKRAPARTPRAAATPATVTTAPAGKGFINVFSRIPLELFIGDKRLGTSESEQLMLSAGHHELRIVNARFHFQGVLPVDVRSGALTSHTVALPSAQVRVTAPDGVQIWVEGQQMGTAPMSVIEVPIGTREIVGRHPQLGERRQTVEVRQGEVALDMNIQTPVGADAAGLPHTMPAGPPPVIAQ